MIIDKQISQLYLQDYNKDLVDKIESVKSTPTSIMKEKQIKEIYLIFASKISSFLVNSETIQLQDIFTEKSYYFNEQIGSFDWPSLDKKLLEKYHKGTNLYYDFLKNKFLIRNKKLSDDQLKIIFDFYRGFFDLVSGKETNELCLSEVIVFQIFVDYHHVYKQLLCRIKENTTLYNEVKDDFWEMPKDLFESVRLENEKDILNCSQEDKINSLIVLNYYSNLFKSKITEISIENKDNIEGFKNAILEKNTYFNNLLSNEKYNEFLKNTYPVLFFDLLIIQTTIKFIRLEKQDNKSILEIIKDLMKAWEFLNIYIKFVRRNFDQNIIQKVYTETIRNYIILFSLTILNSLGTFQAKKLINFLGLDSRDFQFTSSFSIINELKLPFLSELSEDLFTIVINKAIFFSSSLGENQLKEAKKIEMEIVEQIIPFSNVSTKTSYLVNSLK